jgi:hypothetical protein
MLVWLLKEMAVRSLFPVNMYSPNAHVPQSLPLGVVTKRCKEGA